MKRNQKKWADGEVGALIKRVVPVEEAVIHFANFKLKRTFEIILDHRDAKQRLKNLKSKCEAMHNEKIKKRVVRDLLDTYAIQPKLDAIGD